MPNRNRQVPQPHAAEPDISRVPIMLDSSRWEVIEAGLKCIQGKGCRQLNQFERRRGRLLSKSTADSAVRCRRYCHGV